MKQKLSTFFPLLLVGFLLFTAFSINPFGETGPKVGEKVPAFKVQTMDGEVFNLEKQDEKLILVDFWASWCGPCRGEIPHLKEVWSKYKDKGLEIVSINVGELPESAKKFIEKNNMNWTQVFDTEGDISNAYEVMGIPAAFLIGPDGKLLAKGMALRGGYLEDTIEKYLMKTDTADSDLA